MDAKQQIREASFPLFAERGTRSVGVDELIQASGVAKATFYKHFRSKDELVLDYLDQMYERRRAAIEQAVLARGSGPDAMVGVFDVLDTSCARRLPIGASFIHILIESGLQSPVGQACVSYIERFRNGLAAMAERAGLLDPGEFARDLQFVIKGALVSAVEGDTEGLARGRRMAERLVALYRPSEA
ncbi:TetR/AcrR family transcriptional regulator [Sinomonas humi]|uniref:TetR/AcrR family transcriptional regulator n=1 Tax=Sinomonas humi TaxID=1338436 RepID=UPI00068F1DCB|nr:TetR/AcrR family transcriptional regulator [Sinomonas humi]